MNRRTAPAGGDEAVITIHTDGACSGNPGPGGYGVVMSAGSFRREISGSEPSTTNNRMEMMAAIRALEELRQASSVILYTDSSYLRDGITKWIHGWIAKGWKTSTGAAVKNIDLWQRLHDQEQYHSVDWRWLKGHAGHVENERCDQLAVAGARRAAAGVRDELPGERVLPAGDKSPVAPPRASSLQAGPGRNLELKLRVSGLDELRRRLLALGARAEARLKQQDTFFPARQGSLLKMRHEERDGRLQSELIHYRRAESTGVRLSEYTRLPLDDGAQLQTLLASALGDAGSVNKVRELLMLGPTRVHLDQVHGLGTFVEFERVIAPGEDLDAAAQELRRLLDVLGLDPTRSEARPYRDLPTKG
ncbi:MAG: ribonuclease HI [Calditrichaeota bacterium]|nr:ribonuclease HI [Candidatus Cloacimonadota bacterium]MCB1046646.1 ribonuclease HI [Calditrichota bacterium]MCB9473777.1 ribonuclease HI [Candidatus Delongbacteria bacterium]